MGATSQRASRSRYITRKELFQETEDIRVSLADLVTEKLTGSRSWQEIASGLSTNKGSCAQWRETESEKFKEYKHGWSLPQSALSHSRGSRLLIDTLYAGQYRWCAGTWMQDGCRAGLIHNICRPLWYKYSPHGWFQTTKSLATSSQNSWYKQLPHITGSCTLETMGYTPDPWLESHLWNPQQLLSKLLLHLPPMSCLESPRCVHWRGEDQVHLAGVLLKAALYRFEDGRHEPWGVSSPC